MPYEYYSMPFCKPAGGPKRATSTINPGTILLGIRIESSPYNFTIMTEQHGLTVCNGEQYKDHAYPPLSDKEAKVGAAAERGWVLHRGAAAPAGGCCTLLPRLSCRTRCCLCGAAVS